jgi:hypothetical protein
MRWRAQWDFEEATLRQLKGHRKALGDPKIKNIAGGSSRQPATDSRAS